MVLTSASLILSGVVCLVLFGFLVRSAIPRQGRPDSVWTKSENRSTLLALGLVTLLVMGSGLLLKGVLS
jgi:hypothetical protein